MPKLVLPKKKLTQTVSKQLSEAVARVNEKTRMEPLWKGPLEDGITQSMLGRFLSCRERFRLYAVEGLKGKEEFNHRSEYGNLWHACEEALPGPWLPALQAYAKKLIARYREQGTEIDKWYQVCKSQFPVYLKFWEKHPDVINLRPMFREMVFRVPLKLPSGRTVTLRGKWDGGDVIEDGIYLQENKTKGEFYREKLASELRSDLQTMMYLTALHEARVTSVDLKETRYNVNGVRREPGRVSLFKLSDKLPIKGVRYNVVRRPLGGQKYNIQQRKGLGKAKKGAETPQQYYDRLGETIASDPEYFFFRMKMDVTRTELQEYHQKTLYPILENLCDWWEYIMVDPFNPWKVDGKRKMMGTNIHWVYPCGVYNPTLEGRSSVYDECLQTGSLTGLERAETLFRELEE